MKVAIRQFYRYCKWFVVLLACISCMMVILPVYAAEEGTCGENLTWKLSGNVLTISGTGEMQNYCDGGLPGWYSARQDIYTINLPSGLTSIGDYAFLGFENITNMEIPSTVTRIGEYAFAQCINLKQVNLGTGIEKIEEASFQECESMMGISFPESLTYLGSKAFYRCYSIQNVTIPVTVKNMGVSSFAYCTGLVRATVNADMKRIPDWTFYGCESLTDVSLSASVTSLGEYAFQNCENLNAIYTQEGNIDTAYELEQSISQQDGTPPRGIVGTYDMPEYSVIESDNGKLYSEMKIIEVEGTTISVTKLVNTSETLKNEQTIVSAVATNDIVWERIIQVTDETLEDSTERPMIVEIYLQSNIVESEKLKMFAGKAVTVHIITSDATIWKIDMAEMTPKSFSGSYDLSIAISETESETKILSDQVYQLEFFDRIDFNVIVGIEIGSAYELATFYQRDGGTYDAIDTIVVDTDNIAWLSLAELDKRTDYYIGINVEGMSIQEAIVPDTMLEHYKIDEDVTLMDEEGTKYRVTGRTSKWGITGQQFAMYVAVAMLATILIVGCVMISINIVKRSREKYERLAEENALKNKFEEDELRIEIIKEILGKGGSNSKDDKY